jgi:hypothetical protein
MMNISRRKFLLGTTALAAVIVGGTSTPRYDIKVWKVLKWDDYSVTWDDNGDAIISGWSESVVETRVEQL